ncbi:MAG: hypothetical protein H5T73_09905 [Actinobacteria bacterium]|nr:hypothetical protein [Actinomycetota bacterium]
MVAASWRGRLARTVFLAVLFGIGIAVSGFCWNKVRLPFRNPGGITGLLPRMRFSPYNNIARFLIVVFAPCLLLVIAYAFAERLKLRPVFHAEKTPTASPEMRPTASRKARCFLLFALAVFTVVNLLGISNYGTWVDSFHDGETLCPAISYMDGQVPYRDFWFAHGLYQDPLRSVLAFKLFGKSIASMKALQTMSQLVMILLLAFLLYRLFKGDLLRVFATMLLLFVLMGMLGDGLHFIVAEHREMIPILFLILLTYLHELLKDDAGLEVGGRRRRKMSALCFLLSFLPFASLAYSIDRGTYLLATYVLLALAVYLFFVRRSGLARGAVASSSLGIVTGVLFLGYLLRWGYGDFLYFT